MSENEYIVSVKKRNSKWFIAEKNVILSTERIEVLIRHAFAAGAESSKGKIVFDSLFKSFKK